MRQGNMMSQSLHPYTRKELANWVQSHTRYKYQDLKNGVFFCKMLSIKYPEEVVLLKYNLNPISQYDCTHNLNIMKKVLNKRGLQLNLNVHTVLSSKNNFELAKWFKCMFDPTEVLVNNYSSVPRGSISTYRDLPNKKMLQETPKKQGDQKEDKNYKKKMQSAEKSSKNSLSKVKRLSMAKSQAFFFKDKRPPLPIRTELKIPVDKKEKKVQVDNQKYYQTQFLPRSNQFNSENNDINQILYERALQESIESLSKILQKVKKAMDTNGINSYAQYKKQISKAIFTR